MYYSQKTSKAASFIKDNIEHEQDFSQDNPNCVEDNLFLGVNPKREKNVVSRIASESELKRELGFQISDELLSSREKKTKIDAFGKIVFNSLEYDDVPVKEYSPARVSNIDEKYPAKGEGNNKGFEKILNQHELFKKKKDNNFEFTKGGSESPLEKEKVDVMMDYLNEMSQKLSDMKVHMSSKLKKGGLMVEEEKMIKKGFEQLEKTIFVALTNSATRRGDLARKREINKEYFAKKLYGTKNHR